MLAVPSSHTFYADSGCRAPTQLRNMMLLQQCRCCSRTQISVSFLFFRVLGVTEAKVTATSEVELARFGNAQH